jgi:hypothetical protein
VAASDSQPGLPAEAFSNLCSALETALSGSSREEILDQVQHAGGFTKAVKRLRSGMRAHNFKTAGKPVSLAGMIKPLDARTQEEGFHVLQAWDYTAHRFTRENLPALTLDFWANMGVGVRRERASLAILLDNYFLHILALCAMRVWDEGDPNAALDRLTRLVQLLQGPGGSRQQFVSDAETLLVLAVSHFHPSEQAYDDLIDRVRTLNDDHQLNFALISSAVLGSHLRWGFAIMYERDLGRLRDDNTADYPWLLYSVATLMRAYSTMRDEGVDGSERENVVSGLLNGLSADPWAFIEAPPAALTGCGAEHSEFQRRFQEHRDELLEEFERHRPTREAFSPLSFQTNFLPNTLVGMVMAALLQGAPQELPLNALFVKSWADGPDFRGIVAKTLTYYAGSSLDRLGEHGSMLIAYDVQAGMRHYTMTISALKDRS